MNIQIIISVFATLLVCTTTAQTNKQLHFDLEGGTGMSIGRTTYKVYRSQINALQVHQYDKKRYRLPSIILRGSVWRQIAPKFKLGISTGLNIHNLEINTYGNYYNALTIPLQLTGNINLFRISSKTSIESELKSGYNFQKQNFPPIIDKGGPINSLAIVLKSLRKKHNFFLLKLGYESQLDRSIYTFWPSRPVYKKEIIANTIKRNTLYLTAGMRL